MTTTLVVGLHPSGLHGIPQGILEQHLRYWSHSAISVFQGRPIGDRVDGTATPSGDLENRRGQVDFGGEA